MKYSLDINIIHSTEAKCQEVLDQLPKVSSTDVWADQYDKSGVFLNEKGFYQCSCMIRFNEETGREVFWQAVSNIQDIVQGCEIGSYIRKHLCYHDGNPPQPCGEEIVYEVV